MFQPISLEAALIIIKKIIHQTMPQISGHMSLKYGRPTYRPSPITLHILLGKKLLAFSILEWGPTDENLKE
jgi:hypothetical protein